MNGHDSTGEEQRSTTNSKSKYLPRNPFEFEPELSDDQVSNRNFDIEESAEGFEIYRRPSIEPALLKTQSKSTPPIQPPPRVYGIGSARKAHERLGANDIEWPPVAESPERRSRSSWNRVSLTPSILPYEYAADLETLEETIGLRRQSVPPPVPPKDPRRSQIVRFDLSEPSGRTSDFEPENGRKAWMHACAGMLVVFNCWGLSNAYGLFQEYYVRYLLYGTSRSSIAWIGSTQLALVFGLGVPVGRMVDKGYLRLMFHGGSVIMIIGLFSTSLCKTLWTLWLVYGFITGLGMGMCFCSGVMVIMTWFDEKKIGIAMGLGAAGSCIGGIVYILIARYLLPRHGFKTTMLVIGAIVTITMIPPNLLLKMRNEKLHNWRNRKKPNHATPAASHASSQRRTGWAAFNDPIWLVATAGLFSAFMGVYFGFVYMIPYGATELQLPDAAAINLLIYMLAANLPGRVIPGAISSFLGPMNTIIPSILLSSLCVLLWIECADTQRSLTIIACFYGLLSGGIQALYMPTVYSFCLARSPSNQRQTRDRLGIKTGIVLTSIGIAVLVSLPIGGALIRYRSYSPTSLSYLGAQVFAAGSLLAGGLLLLASRVMKIGWTLKRA